MLASVSVVAEGVFGHAHKNPLWRGSMIINEKKRDGGDDPNVGLCWICDCSKN